MEWSSIELTNQDKEILAPLILISQLNATLLHDREFSNTFFRMHTLAESLFRTNTRGILVHDDSRRDCEIKDSAVTCHSASSCSTYLQLYMRAEMSCVSLFGSTFSLISDSFFKRLKKLYIIQLKNCIFFYLAKLIIYFPVNKSKRTSSIRILLLFLPSLINASIVQKHFFSEDKKLQRKHTYLIYVSNIFCKFFYILYFYQYDVCFKLILLKAI